MPLLDDLAGGVVISCQSQSPAHPMYPPSAITRLARCAELGGAVAVRIDHPRNVRAVRRAVSLPVIGLFKVHHPGRRSLITPTFERAAALADAGANVLAVETVEHPGRPTELAAELVGRIRDEIGLPVMADVSTLDEGRHAWDAGAVLVGTTLSGYTAQSPRLVGPDLRLVEQLAEAGIRTVAEGRFRTPEQVARAFDGGAFAVVIGTAVTDPVAITSWLVERSPRAARRTR